MHSRHLLSTTTLILAVSLSLSACNKPAPSDQAAADQPAVPAAGLAPSAAELPAQGTIRPASAGVVRQPYRYIDDAYALGDAFGDSAPDYTVDYGGTRPLIWRSRSGDYRVIERTDDGDRAYYYHSGVDRPFLVQDPRYAYGYDGGALVVIYDASGRPLSQPITARDSDLAARYLSRAAQLYRAAVQQQRLSAEAAGWAARRNSVIAQQRDWAADQQRNDDWRRWHEGETRRQHAEFGDERLQRQADASRFAGANSASGLDRSRNRAEIDQRRQDAQAPPTGQRQQDIQADADRRTQAMARSQAGQTQQRADELSRNQIASEAYRKGQEDARREQAQALAQAQAQAQVQAQAQAARVLADQAKVEEAKRAQVKSEAAKAEQAKVDQAKTEQAKAQDARVRQAQAEQAQRAKADGEARQQGAGDRGKGKAARDKHDNRRGDKHDDSKD